ncbi:hypothetical protein DFH07DRAFT_784391 [Mycena maculata]|uniref:Uncharacterized protein n=1 Tax=Mycena maculata TaxID=230809 RepID=A0AAD7MKF6_9AGAR|nr:hypothetical protein DFH07DRAFT_784391 [Mycena maculata]
MSNLKATLLAPDLGFSTNQVLPSVIGGATPTTSAMMLGSEILHCQLYLHHLLDRLLRQERLLAIRAPVGAVANDTLKEIQLLIDDARPTMGVVNTLQRIRVKYIDSEDCEEGEWRASASEILSALQNSIGRLSGSARIGVPAHFNKSYTEYFVQITANEPLVFETQLLVIPKNDRLNLRVLRIPQADIRPVDPEINWDSLINGASASAATGSAPRTKEPTDRELEWIKAEIKALPGYAKFEANRSKPLQNIDRVEHWRFAFNADKKFYKSNWPSDISTSKITKVPIQLALQMGSTMLAEAIQMIRIIDCYTTEGVHYSKEVVAQISKSDEKDPKATVLKGFLIQWEKDHPVTK